MSNGLQSGCLHILLLLMALVVISPHSAAAQDDADHELGRQVFLEEAQPSCAICHKLADAGAEGAVGPSLDELKATAERVREAILSGPGAMPAYGDTLSEEQIDAVAHYVASVAAQD